MVKKRYDFEEEKIIDDMDKPSDESKNNDKSNKVMNEQKAKINQLEKCLKDKDRRLSVIEGRWETLIGSLSFIFHTVLVIFSYYLVSLVWVFIATNGAWKNGIIDIIAKNINNFLIWWNTPASDDDFICYPSQNIMPQVLSNASGLLLAIVMLILIVILSIIWLFYFTREKEEI